MPSWSDLLREFELWSPKAKKEWIDAQLNDYLGRIAKRRDTNVVVYASSFLQQKPTVPMGLTAINHEDLNGLMASIKGLDFDKGLSLILHTPGGAMTATESFVDYLRAKFDYIESIVPVYPMSGGTLIALNSNKIVMGNQSQLGPIDAQLQIRNQSVSASSILAQFNRAKKELKKDKDTAVAWAPILQAMGPSLLQQAQYALECGEEIAKLGMKAYMFSGEDNAGKKAAKIARYFNSVATHLSHSRRIGLDECQNVGLQIEQLEDDQEFQDEVLTVYHLLTIIFEQTVTVKVLRNHEGKAWVKNFNPPGG